MTHARTFGIGLALASGILAALAPSPAPAAEPVWMLRATTGPGPRYRHAMAYDAARGVTVVFGGDYYE